MPSEKETTTREGERLEFLMTYPKRTSERALPLSCPALAGTHWAGRWRGGCGRRRRRHHDTRRSEGQPGRARVGCMRDERPALRNAHGRRHLKCRARAPYTEQVIAPSSKVINMLQVAINGPDRDHIRSSDFVRKSTPRNRHVECNRALDEARAFPQASDQGRKRSCIKQSPPRRRRVARRRRLCHPKVYRR